MLGVLVSAVPGQDLHVVLFIFKSAAFSDIFNYQVLYSSMTANKWTLAEEYIRQQKCLNYSPSLKI